MFRKFAYYFATVAAIVAAACAPDFASAQIINPNPPQVAASAIAGTGLSQAGAVLSVNYGTVAGTAMQGNTTAVPSWRTTNTITAASNTGPLGMGTLTYSDTNIFGAWQTSANSFAQMILQNSSAGALASTSYLVSNDVGTATTFYGEFGMNSSGFTGTGAFNLPSATYFTSTSSDLAIGTTTANAIHFVVNNGATDAISISGAGVVGGVGLDSYIQNKPIVQTVATVSALRAVSCVSGLLYADQGYYTIGGGGSSTYVCNGADTTSTDNGSTILASANSNRLYLVQSGPVNVKQGGAKCDGTTDDTTVLNTLFANVKNVYVPAGSCKVTATLNIPGGVNLSGTGTSSQFVMWGANGFSVNGDFVTISNIGIFSFTSGGAGDPRTFKGIYAPGTSGTHINYLFVQNVFAQGWSDAAYLAYTWTSKIIGLTTVNTNNGVTLLGQSVNNAISDSTLTVNGGNASILLTPNASDIGEGLMVTNSLLSSGAYGIKSGTGYLSLNVSNCIIDSVSNIGIDVTDARATRIANSWIYAANFGIKFEDLGSAGPENSSFIGNTIQITAASGGQAIAIGALNSNFSIVGNSFTFAGTSIGLFSNGGQVTIDANNFVNNGSNAEIVINTNVGTHWLSNNTGVTNISGGAQAYYSFTTWTPADTSGAALSLAQTTQAVYTKNGRTVNASFDVTYPTTVNASVAGISVPFAPITGSLQSCAVGFQTTGAPIMAAISSAGGAVLTLYTGAGIALTNTTMSTKRVAVTCTYEAAS